MKCRIFITLLLFLISGVSISYAQTEKDSIAFHKLKWQIVTLDKGITWESVSTNALFESKQNINLVRYSPKSKDFQLSLIISTTPTITSTLAKRANSLLAVSGAFFTAHNKMPIGYLKLDGNEVSELTPNEEYKERLNGVVAIDGNKVKVFKLTEDPLLEKLTKYPNIFNAGPILINNGHIEQLDSIAYNMSIDPRTCMAEFSDGKVLIMTIDGCSNDANGMNLFQLSWLLKQMGAINAINLDGRDATTMYVKGEMKNGIVNKPCKGEEQPVFNTLAIVPRH